MEECEAQTLYLHRAANANDVPLMDLYCLTLKRQLLLQATHPEMALHLLGSVELYHSYWLHLRNRETEGQVAMNRAMGCMREQGKPEFYWTGVLKLASSRTTARLGNVQGGLVVYRQWAAPPGDRISSVSPLRCRGIHGKRRRSGIRAGPPCGRRTSRSRAGSGAGSRRKTLPASPRQHRGTVTPFRRGAAIAVGTDHRETRPHFAAYRVDYSPVESRRNAGSGAGVRRIGTAIPGRHFSPLLAAMRRFVLLRNPAAPPKFAPHRSGAFRGSCPSTVH